MELIHILAVVALAALGFIFAFREKLFWAALCGIVLVSVILIGIFGASPP